jgi:hypothetical protein
MMQRNNEVPIVFRPAIAFAALAAVLTVVPDRPAAASSEADAVAACQTALESEGAGRFEGAVYRFRTIRGGGRKRVRFRMTYNGQTETAECFYVGNEVQQIDWPAAFTQGAAASE